MKLARYVYGGFARSLLIFSYGLFTIAAQALLFREFITAFEGNETSVGIFFGSWFLWIAAGALLVYKIRRFAEVLSAHVEFLFLCYLPAFVLQLVLIIQARRLAGIESYTLWSIKDIVLLSVIVNAPVSIITGILFPVVCRWIRQSSALAVSRVYIIESAGSFIGGLGATIFLAQGVSSAAIFLVLALFVSLSSFAVQLAGAAQSKGTVLQRFSSIKLLATFLILLCVPMFFAGRVDKTLMQYVRVVKWTKLFPREVLLGSFQTAQAEYLYGNYRGQWVVVREGSAIESLPDESTAGRIAAIGLSQKPDTKNILVIGTGLALCRQFLFLPQIEHISWAHCDNEYVQKVGNLLPPEFKITDNRFSLLAGDVRAQLAAKKQFYDIVIVNLPDATSSVLNRYYSLEFYRQVRDALRPGGVLQVRVTGGENIMGTELINLGASMKLTLQKVFSRIILTPGDDTWFIASDSENLTGSPGVVRDRFAAIKNANRVFVPDGLLSVYLPDRAAIALENYSNADLPEKVLINRDSRPLANLYSLLLSAKQSGAPAARITKYLILTGVWFFLMPLLVFVVLRFIYVLKTKQEGHGSGFNSEFLVFSAGWVGIGVVIVLMFLYQTKFGSLYLHIGVISSVFMVGLTAGAALLSYLINQRLRNTNLLFAVVAANLLILSAIAFWPTGQWTHLVFAVVFFLCGLCVGGCFPLAARQLADVGLESGQAGGRLETADHFGASAGGMLTGLALVPVLGAKAALFVLAALILANVPLAALRIYTPQKHCISETAYFRLRRFGYILLGVGISVILCSNILAAVSMRLSPSLPKRTAQALAGKCRIEQISTTVSNGAKQIGYFKVYESNDKIAGYIFSSQELSPDVTGFGGKMNLAIYTDPTGKLLNFHIVRSNETPAYLELLSRWLPTLNNRQLFSPGPFAGVNAVTGATVSSKAILAALQTSSHKFAEQVLGQSLQTTSAIAIQKPGYIPDAGTAYLIIACIISLFVIFFGGLYSKLIVLLFNLIIGGFILNTQYSTEQIATILSLHTPSIGLSAAFLLAIGAPLLAVFFGNIYCGYLCPFGAVQELISYIVPAKFKLQPPTEKMQKARFVKYVVLFVLIILFFISRDHTTLTADILISIFSFKSAILLIAAIALIGSIFYSRFWCRYLCPAGAFLSLFNALALLKRYFPAKRYGRCEFGLTAKDNLDCIYCDRCRYQKKPLAEPADSAILAWAVIAAIFISGISVNRFLEVIPSGFEQPAVSLSSGGKSRDVDLQKIRTLIGQNKLSEKEAEFYKKSDGLPAKIANEPNDKRQDNRN
jgi:spermidine synthase